MSVGLQPGLLMEKANSNVGVRDAGHTGPPTPLA